MNTFIHSSGLLRVPLENRTRFQTQMGKVYTRFQANNAKTLVFGAAQTFLAYIRESPPGLKIPKFRGKSG